MSQVFSDKVFYHIYALDAVFNHTGRDFFAFKDIQRHGYGSAYKDWYVNLDSRGGFNTPTLCVVIKGIKARLQPPYENNIPRRCASGLLIANRQFGFWREYNEEKILIIVNADFAQGFVSLHSIPVGEYESLTDGRVYHSDALKGLQLAPCSILILRKK